MRSPIQTPGLRATVLTCVADPATAAFDASALESFTATHAVLEIREHAFQLAGQPLLAFVVVHAGPRATARTTASARPATTEQASTAQQTSTAQQPTTAAPTPRPATTSEPFSAPRRPSRNGDQLHIPACDRPLYDRLCAWRNAEARALGKPGYVLFRNVELAAVAARRPASLTALQEIHGIGKGKAEQFGRGVLAIVQEASAREAPQDPPELADQPALAAEVAAP